MSPIGINLVSKETFAQKLIELNFLILHFLILFVSASLFDA